MVRLIWKKCRSERMKFQTALELQDSQPYTEVCIQTAPITSPLQLARSISPYPFVPSNPTLRSSPLYADSEHAGRRTFSAAEKNTL